jgi:uncharacterized protein YjbJ (UPF0337 family)
MAALAIRGSDVFLIRVSSFWIVNQRRSMKKVARPNIHQAMLAPTAFVHLCTFADVRNSDLSAGVCHPCATPRQEAPMDWNRVEGNWKQMKGKVKEQWGKLTDDDLSVINGNRDQLEGKIQERYGYAKDKAKQDIDDWYTTQNW